MIVIFGSGGYVGRYYRRYFERKGFSFKVVSRSECESRDSKQLVNLFSSHQASFVINCAGYTGKPNVDACELDKSNCLYGNAILPGMIAEACKIAGIPYGHVSSGCIYTGKRADGLGFREEDAPNFSFRTNNCSFYSGTKALGEEILADYPNGYIWRLRIPFDQYDSPRNYLSKVMRYEKLLDAENSISHVGEFVAATMACIEKKVPFGIYNVTNPGSVTTRTIVRWIQESGVCNKSFDFFESESAFMQKAAKTPRSNCVLSTDKLSSVGIEMSPVEVAVKSALKNWVPESK